MFAIPLLPPIPAFLAPATLFSPIKAFLSQPTSIDYTSLPAISASTKPGQPSSTPSNSTAAHSGPFAHLSKSTCPICHLRLTSSPVAIAPAGEAGASISLPRIGGTSLNSTHGDERDGEEDVKAETRIFVPAESDCQGRCRWCYYCIAEQLVRHREEVEARRKKGRGGYEENEEAWSCLRCGGGITRAWRVGEEDTRLEKRQG
jgi:peroxin-2